MPPKWQFPFQISAIRVATSAKVSRGSLYLHSPTPRWFPGVIVTYWGAACANENVRKGLEKMCTDSAAYQSHPGSFKKCPHLGSTPGNSDVIPLGFSLAIWNVIVSLSNSSVSWNFQTHVKRAWSWRTVVPIMVTMRFKSRVVISVPIFTLDI